MEWLLRASECYYSAATSVNDEWLSLNEMTAVAPAALPPACLSPSTATAEDGSLGPYVSFLIFWV